MKMKTFVVAVAAFFCCIFLTPSANAQGVIIPIVCDVRPCRPRPMPQPLPNVLPVKSIQLDTKINGQVARRRERRGRYCCTRLPRRTLPQPSTD